MATFLPTTPSLVETVVQSAWRRRLLVISVEQLAFTLAIVFAGLIIMLLLGTQILDWYWLLLLLAIGSGVAFFRIQRKLIARYRIAQILDERLALQDSISTAWFLRNEGAGTTDGPAARFQLERAEEIAAGVQPVAAFPLGGSSAWALAAVMAVVICGLFTVRYFVNSSLSLRPALVSLPFGKASDQAEAPAGKEKKLLAKSRMDKGTLLAGEQQDPNAASERGQNSTRTDSKSEQNANTPTSGQSLHPQAGGQKGSQNQNGGSGTTKADSQQTASNQAGQQKPTAGQSSPQQKQGNSEGKNPGQQQSSTGLLDKMKDALSGMMAKMSPNQASQSSKQEARNSSPNQKSQTQGSSNKDQNSQSQNNSQNSDSSQTAQASAQASAVEKAQASSGSSSDQKSADKGSDPQSGAGRQDGEKQIKDAEQLKAMGKLAEIIGKRSASVTGEMSVEKPSGQQQLQTQYSDKVGHHADLGGEINRDQIPLEYQDYVREYMNQIHKQANSQ